MSAAPLITVITLVYNNAELVLPALSVIKSQTHANIDHLILDDCSTDNSAAIIQAWIEENAHPCRFIRNEQNLGIPKSLNKLLGLARGDYIGFCSDDKWEPNHLEYSLSNLQTHGCQVVYCKAKVAKPDGQFLYWCEESLKTNDYPNYKELFHSQESAFILDKKLATDALFYCNYLHILSMLASVKHLREMGGFDERLPFEDWDINFRICSSLRVCFINSLHVTYYKHEKSYTEQESTRLPLYRGIVQTLFTHHGLISTEPTRHRVESVIKIYTTEMLKLDRSALAFLVKVWRGIFPLQSYGGIVSALLYRRFVSRNSHLLFLGKVVRNKLGKLMRFQRA